MKADTMLALHLSGRYAVNVAPAAQRCGGVSAGTGLAPTGVAAWLQAP